MKKISVIVPFYNVERYIRQCLKSLEAQTLKDIEVILIDDGSPDRSLAIAEEFVKRNANFHLYRKENGGLGDARNYGMRYAKGDYILFLDSDDMLPPKACEMLYKRAIETDSDIIFGKPVWKSENETKDVEYLKKWFNFDNNKNFREEYTFALGVPIATSKLFKHQLIRDNALEFLCIIGEDVPFSVQAYYYAKKIVIINDIIYWRTERQEESNRSIMQTFDSKAVKDRLIGMRFVEKFCVEKNLNDVKSECFRLIEQVNNIFLKIQDEKDREKAYGFIKTYLESLCDMPDKYIMSHYLGFDCELVKNTTFREYEKLVVGKYSDKYRNFMTNTKQGQFIRDFMNNTKLGRLIKKILKRILKI